MKQTTWLKTQSDPELEAIASQKIALVQQFENIVPGVMIIHDLVTNCIVYMSKWAMDGLGVTLEEIQMPYEEYHARFFNEEDAGYYVPKIFELIERNTDEAITFFQQVRISPDHPWVWHLSSMKIFLRDHKAKPRLTITIALAVDTMHPISSKVERLLEENNFLRSHHQVFATLTRREKEILKMMALGHSSQEIAEQLHISETTANTHRRNIRKKINAQTPYDVTRFARAFDLI